MINFIMTLSREAQQHQDVTKREFVMTVCEPELILEANKKLVHFPHKPLGPVQHWIILYSNHFLGTWSWIQIECLKKRDMLAALLPVAVTKIHMIH